MSKFEKTNLFCKNLKMENLTVLLAGQYEINKLLVQKLLLHLNNLPTVDRLPRKIPR